MNKELIRGLIKELTHEKTVSFHYAGTEITLSVFDQGTKLALSAPVYEGGNYIPQSVRKSLEGPHVSPFTSIKTSLKIDEERFQISLHYLGPASHITSPRFHEVLNEFNDLAQDWRLHLDERDRNDLVHIHVK